MKQLFISAFVTLALFATACTSDSPHKENITEQLTEAFDYRVRPAAQGGTTAAYFVYENVLDIADTLHSAKSPVAGMSQIHKTYKTEDGMMGMSEQKNVVVGPGEQIVFKQGGLHVMLIQLRQNVSEGDSVTVQLNFSQRGEVEFTLPVKVQ